MTQFVEFQGGKIAYRTEGQGPVLVLLHGFLESKEIWDDFISLLQPGFRLLMIDLPGHGESHCPAEIHSMELMADAVDAVLLKLDYTGVVMAGHSMGGYVMAAYASKYPSKVNGIIFFHSHAGADNEEAKENRRRTINIVKENHKGFINQFIPGLFDQNHTDKYTLQIEKLQERAGRMPAASVIAALAGMRDRPSHLNLLLTTDLPVLFIIGKQDSRIPYSQILAQAVIPAHSEVLLLDDVGHMGYIESPVKTAATIRHFALKCFE